MASLRILKTIKAEGYEIDLVVDKDETKAYLSFNVIDDPSQLSFDFFGETLEDAGIVYGVDSKALKTLAKHALAGVLKASDENLLVCSGKPAVNGEDGKLIFHVKPSEEDVRFDLDDDEEINYKENDLITNVSTEQHLATIVEAQPPENGMDIYGRTIEAREGQPLKFKSGQGIFTDGNKIFAASHGRFIYENNELSVNAVYNVLGDVDLTIGNITFIGKVTIQKDILDDFFVSGQEGVEVGGVVAAATVESNADIMIGGGVNGKGRAFIKGQGKIESKYFNEVNVVGWKDIVVTKSIMNSIVKTKGKVDVQNGSIIGGETSALMGIDVGIVGSDMGTMTAIIAGQDYELQDRLKAYESQLLEIGQEIDRIDRVIGPILSNKEKLLALPVDKKKHLKSLLEGLKNYREQQARVRSESEALQKSTSDVSVKEIRVRKILYSGVRVTIGNCKKIIKMEIKGPVRLREDLENDTISITNLTL